MAGFYLCGSSVNVLTSSPAACNPSFTILTMTSPMTWSSDITPMRWGSPMASGISVTVPVRFPFFAYPDMDPAGLLWPFYYRNGRTYSYVYLGRSRKRYRKENSS